MVGDDEGKMVSKFGYRLSFYNTEITYSLFL